jgi:hypothetical protein
MFPGGFIAAAGKPRTKIIEEDADWISFTMWNMGIISLKSMP